MNEKAVLLHYLTAERNAVMWKVEGLGERSARRPLTPTGTNLAGLVKHLACVEYGYFGLAVGRPPAEPLPGWGQDDDPMDDMWATAEESLAGVVAFYRRAIEHADAAISALDLDTPVTVPWWGPNGATTLRILLVHVIAETARHAGHADILREGLDGARGRQSSSTNLPEMSEATWAAYVDRLQGLADQFSD